MGDNDGHHTYLFPSWSPGNHLVIVGHLASQRIRSILLSQHPCHCATYIRQNLDVLSPYGIDTYVVGHSRIRGVHPPANQGRVAQALGKQVLTSFSRQRKSEYRDDGRYR
jgi:hypothetical protein